MNPIDDRTATFDLIKDSLAGKRRIVYDALRTLGPQTTRGLAALARMELLTVRPRVTELIDLGLVELVEQGAGSAEQGARSGEGSPAVARRCEGGHLPRPEHGRGHAGV